MSIPPERPGPIFLPRAQGIPGGKALELLATGWVVIPNLSVVQGGGVIATPGAPVPIGTQAVDLWLPPRSPLVPQAAVIQSLVIAEQQGGAVETLDIVSRDLFDVEYRVVRQEFMKAVGANIVQFPQRVD